MVGHDAARPRAPRPGEAPPRAVSGAARLLRGWTGAVVMTVLAALSHAAAGHGAAHPGPALVAAAAVLAAPVCTLLAGRTLSLWRTVVAVGAAQGILHVLYALAGSGVDVVAAPGVDPAHLAHGGAAPAVAGPLLTAAADPASAHAAETSALPMLAAHLLAAVLTVVLLRHGERTLVAAAERALEATPVLRLLVRLLLPTPAPRRRGPVPAGPPAPRRRRVLELGTAGRRGPPEHVLAA